MTKRPKYGAERNELFVMTKEDCAESLREWLDKGYTLEQAKNEVIAEILDWEYCVAEESLWNLRAAFEEMGGKVEGGMPYFR